MWSLASPRSQPLLSSLASFIGKLRASLARHKGNGWRGWALAVVSQTVVQRRPSADEDDEGRHHRSGRSERRRHAESVSAGLPYPALFTSLPKTAAR